MLVHPLRPALEGTEAQARLHRDHSQREMIGSVVYAAQVCRRDYQRDRPGFTLVSMTGGERAKSPAGRKAKKVTFNTLVTKALFNQRPARPP
jgi:hypothetical protein